MRTILTAPVALTLLLALAGCTVPMLKDDAPEGPAAVQGGEVDKLLAQPYIDPLTDFITAHATDPEQGEAVARLKAERLKRCDEVAKRYETRDTTRIWLNRLRQGYGYSCPDVVEAFATQVEAADGEAADADATDATEECTAALEDAQYDDAQDLCRPLAEQGAADAQLVLGRLYAEGLGVIRNPQEAFVWFSLAEYGGHPSAAAHRREASRLLGDEQVFEAEERMLKISERYPAARR